MTYRFPNSRTNKFATEPLVYKVSKEQTAKLELTYENLSKNGKTVAVDYYFSTNDAISTCDRFFASSSQSLCRNTMSTAKKTHAIPTNLMSRQRCSLDEIVDYTDALSEAYEHNNATYVGHPRPVAGAKGLRCLFHEMNTVVATELEAYHQALQASAQQEALTETCQSAPSDMRAHALRLLYDIGLVDERIAVSVLCAGFQSNSPGDDS